MDPVTALGVVSAAIAIVDGATKTLGLAWEIYNSVEGSTEETEFRLKLSERVRDVSQRLIPTDQLAISKEEQGLVSLARDCNQLSRDIVKELEKLRPKRRKSALQSTLAAARTVGSKRKIEGLEKQLSECHKQLHFQISYLSRRDLKALLAEHNESGAKLTKLDKTLNTLQNTLQNVNETNVRSIDHDALAQIRDFLAIGHEALCDVVQDRVLRGVQGGFGELDYRYQSVERPFGDTFEWIFDIDESNPEAARFTDWLSSGGGIFHICGKPGSGKSTLMKKLFEHAIMRTEVEKWARANGDRKLIMANFFFYALGTDSRQQSLAGLYRTLLYHIVRQRPLLTKDIFPAQWIQSLSESEVRSALVIGDDEVKTAFDLLAHPRENDPLNQYCFCFFIDGLDEYQVTTSADRGDLVDKLLELTNNQSKTFKLCVSSREENPFMDMLSHDNRFRLHKLTFPDMCQYVEGRLPDMVSLQERQKLVSVITSKAEGVFLWVALVVQGIRQRVTDGAGFSSLLRETESLPNDLNELFGRILDAVNPDDRVHFSDVVLILRFLETVTESDGESDGETVLWLELDDFYFLDEYEADHHFAQTLHDTNRQFMPLRETRVLAKRRLRGVCKGLVETIGQEDDESSSRLNFIHRTVSDFLRSDDRWKARSDEPSNALDVLSQLKLASLTHFWWEAAGIEIPGALHQWENERLATYDLSRMIDILLEERHRIHLDTSPFTFLSILDKIPGLSVNKSLDRAFAHGSAWLGIFHRDRDSDQPYFTPVYISCIQPNRFPYDNFSTNEIVLDDLQTIDLDDPCGEQWQIVSPLITELGLGREEYPNWRLENTHIPVEADELVVLAYSAIGYSLGDEPGYGKFITNDDGHEVHASWHPLLRRLFEGGIVSPSLQTHIGFGYDFGLLRISGPRQSLSIWEHFVCWWITVTAIHSGHKRPKNDTGSRYLIKPEYERELNGLDYVLETLMSNGADLKLLIKIEVAEQIFNDFGPWVNLKMEITTDDGEVMRLDTALNLKVSLYIRGYSRLFPQTWYPKPPADKEAWSEALQFPGSHLTLRDWIKRSQQPKKESLLKLMDQKLGVEEEDGKSSMEVLQLEECGSV